MNLPEGSKRANIAFAEREVCTAVGYCIVRGSVRNVEIGFLFNHQHHALNVVAVAILWWLEIRRGRPMVVAQSKGVT